MVNNRPRLRRALGSWCLAGVVQQLGRERPCGPFHHSAACAASASALVSYTPITAPFFSSRYTVHFLLNSLTVIESMVIWYSSGWCVDVETLVPKR